MINPTLKPCISISLLVLLFGCQHSNNIQSVSINSLRTGSFYVEYNSKNGSNKLHFFNNSIAYTFDHNENKLTLFSISQGIFEPTTLLTLPKDISMWFHSFISYDGKSVYMIDNKNSIWQYDLLSDSTFKLGTINTSLEVLHDYSASQPLSINLDTLLLYQCYKNYPRNMDEFRNYANSSPFLKVHLQKESQETSDVDCSPFGDYPSDLLSFHEPYPRFTYNMIENYLVVCYEPLDSITSIKPNGQQVSEPIDNKYYTRPKPNSPQDLLEPKTKNKLLEYYSSNFRYTGIRFNKNTNHYLLTFTTPQPSIKDWINTPMKGIVLDSNFKTLYYIEFELDTKPLKRGDFVMYGDKVAIRTNNIEPDKTNYEKYYIIDF